MNPGYFTAAASAVFNGCFAVIFKQYAKEVHPLAFTSFFSLGFLALFVLSIAIDSEDVILTNKEDTDVLPMFCPCTHDDSNPRPRPACCSHTAHVAQDGLFSGATVTTTFNLTWYAVRVPSVGLATAQGIVSTFNALVSFGVGVLLFRNPITSWVEAACGLGLLCLGISLVVAAKFTSREIVAPSSESALLSEEHEQGRKTWTCSSTRSDPSTARGPAVLQSIDSVGSTAVMPDASASSSVLVFASSTAALPEVAEAGHRDLAEHSGAARKRVWAGILQRLFGWACAAGAGTAGGFTLAGLTLSPPGCQGIVYLPAVGVGCVLTQLAWLGAQGTYYALFIRRDEESLLATFAEQLRYNTRSFRYVVAGIIAGIIYGAGLLLSLVSTYYVGEALAGPIFQFNIIIDGIWGTFLYSEIVGWKGITIFFTGALLVVGAGILLAQATN